MTGVHTPPADVAPSSSTAGRRPAEGTLRGSEGLLAPETCAALAAGDILGAEDPLGMGSLLGGTMNVENLDAHPLMTEQVLSLDRSPEWD